MDHWSSVGQPNIQSCPKLRPMVKLMLQSGRDAHSSRAIDSKEQMAYL